jgi:predicted nucleic acid-binding protein
MIFIDSNVLIDVFNRDDRWSGWSTERLRAFNLDGVGLLVNAIVVAEIASNFPTQDELERVVGDLGIEIVPLGNDTAFAAGRAFREYRRRTMGREAILADFLIGAHALTIGASLLTRDARLYRNYFPELTLITPDTDHG